ncbi:hypothetical protein [Allokutzneria oryzae]|uniref:Integral membrane protein n=1 Tax=Allokutzneria oryzae TaxID=1378989 RepID=A0ABV5ZN86_9PSEU
MTEPEESAGAARRRQRREQDPGRRPRNVDLAAVFWGVVGAAILLLLLLNLAIGADPAAPVNSAALFGGLTVLWCVSGLRKGWRGPRIYLAVVAVVLVYLAVAIMPAFLVPIPPLAIGYGVVGVLATVATVLMFQPDANAYVREMTRR